MFPRPAARRIAAALTAALVAVLLVTFSGPTRTPSQRLSVAGISQAGSAAKATRVQHDVPLVNQQQAPSHLDLATTPPSVTADARRPGGFTAVEAAAVRSGSDLVAPTGRAPPAL